MKIGLSISTHSSDDTTPKRIEIIKECLDSVPQNDNIYVNIVADGVVEEHKKLLDIYPFDIIYQENRGISSTKNIGIKNIIDNGCDIGFLMDDDMIIKDEKVFDHYSNIMKSTGIPHFSYYIDRNNCQEIILEKNVTIAKTPLVNGCLLTFTKDLIEDIGYFKILPYKYGHEHSNFSRRCLHYGKIPFFCDIINANKYIELNPDSINLRSGVFPEYDSVEMKTNEKISYSLDRYVPFNL